MSYEWSVLWTRNRKHRTVLVGTSRTNISYNDGFAVLGSLLYFLSHLLLYEKLMMTVKDTWDLKAQEWVFFAWCNKKIRDGKAFPQKGSYLGHFTVISRKACFIWPNVHHLWLIPLTSRSYLNTCLSILPKLGLWCSASLLIKLKWFKGRLPELLESFWKTSASLSLLILIHLYQDSTSGLQLWLKSLLLT